MSFRGRGQFRGRGGGRGGNFGSSNPLQPNNVIEAGIFEHPCAGDIVCKVTLHEKVPYNNAYVFLDNKESIGKVDEIFGKVNHPFFSVKLNEGIDATSFKKGHKFFVDDCKTLPLSRFTNPAPPRENYSLKGAFIRSTNPSTWVEREARAGLMQRRRSTHHSSALIRNEPVLVGSPRASPYTRILGLARCDNLIASDRVVDVEAEDVAEIEVVVAGIEVVVVVSILAGVHVVVDLVGVVVVDLEAVVSAEVMVDSVVVDRMVPVRVKN
ncbi:H/ACA snoRNP pseudouridylase subunit, partial [Cichlidogyrus casuarinus]